MVVLRMQPLRPPVCVSRVAIYSRIWRQFDRGLYLFIKHQIYLPILRPTFSLPRKVAAGALAFLGRISACLATIQVV